jgi:hypothetical protein
LLAPLLGKAKKILSAADKFGYDPTSEEPHNIEEEHDVKFK